MTKINNKNVEIVTEKLALLFWCFQALHARNVLWNKNAIFPDNTPILVLTMMMTLSGVGPRFQQNAQSPLALIASYQLLSSGKRAFTTFSKKVYLDVTHTALVDVPLSQQGKPFFKLYFQCVFNLSKIFDFPPL